MLCFINGVKVCLKDSIRYKQNHQQKKAITSAKLLYQHGKKNHLFGKAHHLIDRLGYSSNTGLHRAFTHY